MKASVVLIILLLYPGIVSADEKATFAGGCFWCMEPPFEKLDGVKSVISGYTGGKKDSPSYKEVSSGKTKHIEAVQITYDPKKISYNDLLEVLWRNIDPTDTGGQFVDRGHQYTTAIFYHSEEQKRLARESKKRLKKSKRFKKKIVTPIRKFEEFYRAENYHQDFYKKSPVRYKFYRAGSGRDKFINKTWGDDKTYKKGKKMNMYERPSDDVIKKRLNDIQYKVTQKDGTEPPFQNKYWDNKEEGIYVDIVSGEPLFSSKDKFKSGTGWPSFTRPIETDNIVEKSDRKFFVKRTEVRSRHGDSHLGHVFNDGPEPTGLRYCINSASLRFVPVEDLEKEGYAKYKSLFEKANQ